MAVEEVDNVLLGEGLKDGDVAGALLEVIPSSVDVEPEVARPARGKGGQLSVRLPRRS